MRRKDIIIGVAIFGAFVITVFFLVTWSHGISIGVTNSSNGNGDQKKASSIAGLNCDNAGRRPIAVMLESDPEGRPLAGIGQADIVVEMPVTPDGITRFMAVYQCQDPKEIGAIRSARQDFIPLADGFEAIYAHWGGEHGALAELDSHVMDNINGLQFDGTVFYRKPNIAPPHNGFSNLDLLTEQAKKFNYGLTDVFAGYPHTTDHPIRNLSNIADTISVDYPSPNNVTWTYDPLNNVYLRNRGGTAEIDKNTNRQVSASVIAVMNTTDHILTKGDQYIVVSTTGQGSAEIYQDGIGVQGTWKKDPLKLDAKLYFYDSAGKEIQFTPGQIWVEVNPTWKQ